MFAIGPLKMEFLSRNPDIVQIYDAFSDKQIDEIITELGELSPSLIVDLTNATGGLMITDPRRLSSGKNLDPDSFAEKRINRKVALMTGLQSIQKTAKEEAQVINYVIGGHFESHRDSVCFNYSRKYCVSSSVSLSLLRYPTVDNGRTCLWGQRGSHCFLHGQCKN